MLSNKDMQWETIKNVWEIISIEKCKKLRQHALKNFFAQKNPMVNLSYV